MSNQTLHSALQVHGLSSGSADVLLVAVATLAALCVIFLTSTCCLLARQWHLRRQAVTNAGDDKQPLTSGTSGAKRYRPDYIALPQQSPLPSRSNTPVQNQRPFTPDEAPVRCRSPKPRESASLPNFHPSLVETPANDREEHPYIPSAAAAAPSSPASRRRGGGGGTASASSTPAQSPTLGTGQHGGGGGGFLGTRYSSPQLSYSASNPAPSSGGGQSSAGTAASSSSSGNTRTSNAAATAAPQSPTTVTAPHTLYARTSAPQLHVNVGGGGQQNQLLSTPVTDASANRTGNLSSSGNSNNRLNFSGPKQQVISPLIEGSTTGSSATSSGVSGGVGQQKAPGDRVTSRAGRRPPPLGRRRLERSQSWTEDELMRQLRPRSRDASPVPPASPQPDQRQRQQRSSSSLRAAQSTESLVGDKTDSSGIDGVRVTPTRQLYQRAESTPGTAAEERGARSLTSSPVPGDLAAELNPSIKFTFYYTAYSSNLTVLNLQYFESPHSMAQSHQQRTNGPTQSLFVRLWLRHDPTGTKLKTGPAARTSNPVDFRDVFSLKVKDVGEACRSELVLEVCSQSYTFGPMRKERRLAMTSYSLGWARDVEMTNDIVCPLQVVERDSKRRASSLSRFDRATDE